MTLLGVGGLAMAITLLIGNRREPGYHILFVVAVTLLFVAAMLAVRSERPLIQLLVYIGAALCLIAVVAAQSLIGGEKAGAAPETNCALLYAPTPTSIVSIIRPENIAPTPTPIPRAPPPAVELAAKWPRNMDINGSDFVGVTLSHEIRLPRKSHGVPKLVPTVVVAGKRCRLAGSAGGRTAKLVATPIGVGTPGVAIEKAFGLPYSDQVAASAGLEAIKFDATPNNPTWQSIDQRVNEWGWTITPRTVGRQVMIIDVSMRWQATGRRTPAFFQRLIWESNPIYVTVQAPLITTGQFNVSTLLSGALATGLVTLVTALIAKFVSPPHEKES